MAMYKEIVTKAIIGKGKKTSDTSCEMTTEINPDTILGCWVINHQFSGSHNNESINVNGSFDVNVWYSYDNNSKTSVATARYDYTDKMKMKLRNDASLSDDSEIIVRSLKQPTVTDVRIDNGIVKMNVQKELGIEIVGDTMVKVSVEEDEDDYDIIEDDMPQEELNNIDTEVNEDYIN